MKKRIPSIIICIVTVTAIVFSAYGFTCRLLGTPPDFFGYSYIRIISQSMEDTIMTGDCIVVENVGADKIEVGDIITFYSSDPDIYNMLNTHRVVSVSTDEKGNYSFVTMGDNNNGVEDEYKAYGSRLVGRYVRKSPVMTFFNSFLSEGAGIAIVFFAALALLVILIIRIQKNRAVQSESDIDARVAEEVERLKAIMSADKSGKQKDNSDNTAGLIDKVNGNDGNDGDGNGNGRE